MGLAGALGLAVGLKRGRNQATVTGLEGCLQIVAFTILWCAFVQSSWIKHNVWYGPGDPEVRVGIQGHAVAEAPTGVARALLYIVRGFPFLLPFLYPSIIQAILPYLSSVRTNGFRLF